MTRTHLRRVFPVRRPVVVSTPNPEGGRTVNHGSISALRVRPPAADRVKGLRCRPAYTAEEYADLRAQAEVDSLVEQYGEVALSHFARQMAQLDPERRRALQRVARRK